jgi:hypothetical protein
VKNEKTDEEITKEDWSHELATWLTDLAFKVATNKRGILPSLTHCRLSQSLPVPFALFQSIALYNTKLVDVQIIVEGVKSEHLWCILSNNAPTLHAFAVLFEMGAMAKATALPIGVEADEWTPSTSDVLHLPCLELFVIDNTINWFHLLYCPSLSLVFRWLPSSSHPIPSTYMLFVACTYVLYI